MLSLCIDTVTTTEITKRHITWEDTHEHGVGTDLDGHCRGLFQNISFKFTYRA